MLYLSSLGIVHRDLASRNVLMKEDLDDDQRRRQFVAKVSDFGLSRVVTPQEGYYRSESGLMPIQWSAPEALRHKRFSAKTGIWSYGVLLWEIFSGGAEPYNGLTCPELRIHVEGGGRLSKPARVPRQRLRVHAALLGRGQHGQALVQGDLRLCRQPVQRSGGRHRGGV